MTEQIRTADCGNNMSKQIEITERIPLLDADGRPAQPGWCRRNLYIYNKEAIRRSRCRIKEWDYYMITDGRWKVELNFFNISAIAALTAEVVDLQNGKRWKDLVLEPSTPAKYDLSPAADAPFRFRYQKLGKSAEFAVDGLRHTLSFDGRSKGKPLRIRVSGDRLPQQESLTMLTPFKNPRCFFYSQKLNCIAASAEITAGGKTFRLDPEKAFMVMDWARGVWPYRNMWYWSNGSTYVNGKRFGFELTWGFGDETNATETALFYDGKCHKIGKVRLEQDPRKSGWMKPWHFISDDGRLDLVLTPSVRRSSGLVFLGLLGHRSEQVYGCFNGHVVLDDGTRLEIRDMFAFAERASNCW